MQFYFLLTVFTALTSVCGHDMLSPATAAGVEKKEANNNPSSYRPPGRCHKPKPKTKPTKPKTMPTKPKTKPTKPKTMPTKPKTKPTKPKTKPTKPKTKPTKPKTKPTKPKTMPTKPKTMPTKPKTKPTKPKTKPTKPKTKPTKPKTMPTKPKTKPTKPKTQPTKPKTKPTKPKTKPTKPKTQPTKPKTKPTKPTRPDCYRRIGQEINSKAAYGRRGWSVYLKMGTYRFAIGGYRAKTCRIRMYEYDGSDWTPVGQQMYGEATNEPSGWTVALNAAANRLTICAQFNDGTTLVRIHDYNGDFWKQNGPDVYGEFEGQSTDWIASWSLDGDQVSIGHDTLGRISEDVCMYDYEDKDWKELCPCRNGDPDGGYYD